MKIYLASRYSRRLELRSYQAQLEWDGHKITSRWLDGHHGESFEAINDKERRHAALEDERDILKAEAIVAFTEEPRSSLMTGGRHVEFGIARQAGLDLIVVGPRENVFYYFPAVKHFGSFETARTYLRLQ